MTRVGTKGQIVIEKDLRERLGIGPGWHAVQEVHGTELVVRFEPPLHRRSLGGIFRKYADGIPPLDNREIEAVVAEAISDEWLAREADGSDGG